MRILLCRTGWMNYYQGPSDNDAINGGGRWVLEHQSGHEIFNFMPSDDAFYGNAQPTHDGQINLQRIDNNLSGNEEYATNVLVIWCATRPNIGGTVVVGWYKNATVYRLWTELPATVDDGRRQSDITHFRIKADAGNAFLLKPELRTKGIGGANNNNCRFGQSNIRYLDKDNCQGLKNNIIRYIVDTQKDSSNFVNLNDTIRNDDGESERGVWGATNPEVEEKAIAFARKYYEEKNYTVKSVEKLNRGWDLEATRDNRTLHIEVKGLSGVQCAIKLTANEYKAFQSADDNYRLFVVTSSLTDTPSYFICKKVNDHMVFWDGSRKYECVANEIISAQILSGREIGRAQE